MARPGEADVGVLLLARRRVLGLGVVDVPLLELAGLSDGFAEDDAEADPERVEGGQQPRCSRRW